ncbi:PREDICTED: gastrula zinc finger protein XlCGF8.2DB-like isoform X2 [Nicrophorus vespilloides]|uniref:Gastrula zinc finger protein XlCGF8.2DB-like isoform X2 n=1 Tax=Nicrophorus vespilloides TaxID=110193 RepID=A0ABM1MBR0_NICVS|nr:PREDICTED: gastrula zinc finger protein XlCGF8.2DB-like isoform X2 [Nicrophorus vespilloides]
MCTTTNFAYWQVESQNAAEDLHNYSIQNVLQDSKNLKIRKPMFFMNSLTKQEDTYDKSPEKLEKHLISPFATVQLTPDEYNQIISKRHETLTHKVEPSAAEHPAPTKIRPFSCAECGKTFLLKHHLTTHEKTHSGIKPHSCHHCGKAFTHKHCLNTHLLLHSSQRPYQCIECKKSFTLKHHLITHSRVHSRDRPFVCKDCGRTFPLKRHLVTHSKFHAGERPHICNECGESFAQKDHLIMHSRFHGSLNSFVCHDCGASFTRKFELVNHHRLHGKMPHSCPICQKEFLQKRTLITHMSAKHGLQQHNKRHPEGTCALKSHVCSYCNKGFYQKNHLLLHQRQHMELKMKSEDIKSDIPSIKNESSNNECTSLTDFS